MEYIMANTITHYPQHVANRFELVSLSAHLVIELNSGSNIMASHAKKDSNLIMTALNGILTEEVNIPELREKLILKHQTQSHNYLSKLQKNKFNNDQEGYFNNFESDSEFDNQQIYLSSENLSIINDDDTRKI
ncbi:hypothetical protein F0363_09095 [Orientia tsutsugamushi]|nr:hypothetical protein F0363_09095 [Orientia tsutsugamushi]